MQKKRKVGRPSKYEPRMCDVVISMMKEGKSRCQVAAALDVNDDTLVEWEKKIPEFSATIKRGEQLSKAWWLEKGRANLENKTFSPVLWYMNMKNRFGWSDVQKVQHEGSLHIHID